MLSIPLLRSKYFALRISVVISGRGYGLLFICYCIYAFFLSMYSSYKCYLYSFLNFCLSPTTVNILFMVSLIFFNLGVCLSFCVILFKITLSARSRFFSFTQTNHSLWRSSVDFSRSYDALHERPLIKIDITIGFDFLLLFVGIDV